MAGRKLITTLVMVLILVSISLISLTLSGQPVYAADTDDISSSFTDANFKQAVWEWLGNSGDPGSFIKQDLINRMADKNYTLDVSNKAISCLQGLENFEGTGLLTLDCGSNTISTWPTLPSSLTSFNCSSNSLTVLPSLPGNLRILICDNNSVTTLPGLPGTLKSLNCDANKLTSLPELPTGLEKLYCGNNNISEAPTLPDSLKELGCYSNRFVLPDHLPDLTILNCQNNGYSRLPNLPDSLKELNCDHCYILELPDLPNSLEKLHCSDNWFSNLPELPGGLKELYCDENNLIYPGLPQMPNSLETLSCVSSRITHLPELPNGLKKLNCKNNIIGSLPILPESLQELYCSHNYVNVFTGEVAARINELPLTEKEITPQYRYFYRGDALILKPYRHAIIDGWYIRKESSEDGISWSDITYPEMDEMELSSSDENVARVDDNWVAHAYGPGSCFIYASFYGLDSEFTTAVIPVSTPATGANLVLTFDPPLKKLPRGEKVSITVLVENKGDIEAPKNRVEFYVYDELVATKKISKLKPGKSQRLKFKLIVPTDQSWLDMKIELRSSDAFPGNDYEYREVRVVKSDLTVTSVTPKKDLIAGKPGTLNVGITNQTIATAGKFVVRVYWKGNALGEKNVSKLKPGSKALSIKINVPTDFDPAKDILNIVADANNQIEEQDEDNNTMSYPNG